MNPNTFLFIRFSFCTRLQMRVRDDFLNERKDVYDRQNLGSRHVGCTNLYGVVLALFKRLVGYKHELVKLEMEIAVLDDVPNPVSLEKKTYIVKLLEVYEPAVAKLLPLDDIFDSCSREIKGVDDEKSFQALVEMTSLRTGSIHAFPTLEKANQSLEVISDRDLFAILVERLRLINMKLPFVEVNGDGVINSRISGMHLFESLDFEFESGERSTWKGLASLAKKLWLIYHDILAYDPVGIMDRFVRVATAAVASASDHSRLKWVSTASSMTSQKFKKTLADAFTPLSETPDLTNVDRYEFYDPVNGDRIRIHNPMANELIAKIIKLFYK